MESLTGQVVGHYRLTHAIDDRGVCPVYRADHIHYGNPAAVKVLTSRLSDHPSLREWFQREAETLTRIRHPNLVRVTDFIVEDEFLALAMALLEGESLEQELTRRQTPYTASEAAPRILPAAATLAAAHAQGGLHGALTPSKVMLTLAADGTLVPRILGFGVAPILQFRRPTPAHPASAAPTSSPRGQSNPLWYLAPEQCRAEPTLGPAVDQYGLAVLLYQLLTGRVPCDGVTDEQILEAHLHQMPPSPAQLAPGLPPPLASVLLRALAKNPEERWPTVDAFAGALREAIPPSTAVVPPPTHQQSTVETQRPPAVTNAVPPAGLTPTAPIRHGMPQPQPQWGANAPPAGHPRGHLVTWWILVLAFVVAGSAALIVWALMSRNAPEPPARGSSATPSPRPFNTPSDPRHGKPPMTPDAGAQPVPIPLQPLPIPAPIARTGSETCDRYLKGYQCYVDRLPAVARAPATTALHKMADTWRKMITAAGARDIVEASCKSAYETMTRGLKGQPLAKGCFPALPNPRPPTQPPSQTGPAPATATIGVPACDAYVRVYRCFQSKMPPSVQAPMEKAIDQVLSAWKTAAVTAQGKKGLKMACEMALAAFRKTVTSYAGARDCVK